MAPEVRTCPGCGLCISTYGGSSVLHRHNDPRTGHLCDWWADAAEADDQWILILREELDCAFADIADKFGITTSAACSRYYAARRREDARVRDRGWA